MNNILATTSSFGKGSPPVLKDLQEKGFNVVVNPYGRKLTEEELKELLNQRRPVGLLAGTEPVTDSVLKAAKDYLKVISRVGVGWDNVDKQTAGNLGIQVFRTTGVLNQAVAEYIRFLHIAKGSSAELRTQVYIAQQIAVINQKTKNELVEELKIISSMLHALIKSLKPKLKTKKILKPNT